jgi:hypothetical protein
MNQGEEPEHLLNANDVDDWPMDEKTKALEHIAHRDGLLAWIRKYKGFDPDLLTEYCVEAEHQDGVEYWDHFKDPKDLATDIRGYISVRD